jgi:hypothetical protein
VEALVGGAGDHVDARVGQLQLLGAQRADRVDDDADVPGTGGRSNLAHGVQKPGRSFVVDDCHRIDRRVRGQSVRHRGRVDRLGLGCPYGHGLDAEPLRNGRQAVSVDAVAADQQAVSPSNRGAYHRLHRGCARPGDERELPVAADAGDAEQLLADPPEDLRILRLAMAEVRAGDGAMDPVAHNGRSGVEEDPLAVPPVSPVQLGVHHRELGRSDDAIRLAEQEIDLARPVGYDADHGPGPGPPAGDQGGPRAADHTELANVRNVGRGEGQE